MAERGKPARLQGAVEQGGVAIAAEDHGASEVIFRPRRKPFRQGLGRHQRSVRLHGHEGAVPAQRSDLAGAEERLDALQIIVCGQRRGGGVKDQNPTSRQLVHQPPIGRGQHRTRLDKPNAGDG